MKSHTMMIVSSDSKDTPLDIEEKLQKAVATLKEQQESREIPDLFLKSHYQTTSVLIDQIYQSMLDEISEVLTGGDGT